MKKPVRILTQFDALTEPRTWFTARLAVYFGVWLLALLALQIFLQPEGATESSFTATQQRLLWLPYTPLMVVVGLAQAATWPGSFPNWAPWMVVGVLVGHALVALTRVRRSSFVVLIGVQVVLFGVAVFYFVRQAQLPTGG